MKFLKESKSKSVYGVFWVSIDKSLKFALPFENLLVIFLLALYEHFREGPEGVKWELGFAYFCTGKMGFGSVGLGITNTKLGMGNMFIHCTAYVVNAQ